MVYNIYGVGFVSLVIKLIIQGWRLTTQLTFVAVQLVLPSHAQKLRQPRLQQKGEGELPRLSFVQDCVNERKNVLLLSDLVKTLGKSGFLRRIMWFKISLRENQWVQYAECVKNSYRVEQWLPESRGCGKQREVVKGYKLPVIRQIYSGDVI